jgi:hypothetical protein
MIARYRRPILLLLVLTTVGTVPCADEATSEMLGVEDVVRLYVSGVSTEALIEKIREARVDFDLSEEMQSELRVAGIPPQLIEAMLERHRQLHPPAVEGLIEPEGQPAAGLIVRFKLLPEGVDTLSLHDTVPAEALQQLGVNDGQARITDVALYVACLSAKHVPDHWRSQSPLGRDFTSMPRHRMLAWVARAIAEESKKSGGGGGKSPGAPPRVLRLSVPDQVEFELDTAEAHDISVGLAIEIGGRFYRVESAEVEDLTPELRDAPLRAEVTAAANLSPGEVKISVE